MKPQSFASKKVQKSMHEMKAGTLHSGGPGGPAVTNRKQAIAIGLSEAQRDEEAGETAPDDEAAEARPRKGSLRGYGRGR